MSVRNGWWVMVLCLGLTLLAGGANAGDSIKERMLSRVPEINALKAKGVVGESNQGFLAFVGGQQEKAAIVDSENADRRQVYEAIAKQQGTAAALVGQRRALQIEDSAESGTWLQAADGSWRKK